MSKQFDVTKTQEYSNAVKAARVFIEAVFDNRPNDLMAKWEFTGSRFPCDGMVGNVDELFLKEATNYRRESREAVVRVLEKIFGKATTEGIMFAVDTKLKRTEFIITQDKIILMNNKTFMVFVVKPLSKDYEQTMTQDGEIIGDAPVNVQEQMNAIVAEAKVADTHGTQGTVADAESTITTD